MKTVKVTSQQALLATLNNVTGAPHGMLAPPDSHFNSRGLEVPSGGRGVVLFMKNLYGLELLENHF